MKTKQAKEDAEKGIDEDTVSEPKTRARKKASDANDEETSKSSKDEPKTSKETKRPVGKPRAVVRKRPLGISKTLRNKKVVVIKEKIKTAAKQGAKRGRKPAIKAAIESVPLDSEKETVPLIPASEIKKEPIEDATPNSRSSSPKTAGRRPRLSSDMIMLKSVLGDTPSSLVLGPRTSPYSMRSERSNSPSSTEAKNLRSGKPRKQKSNLLNQVVKKEQNKRRRLLSDSKANDSAEGNEDCKKLKRGRSCSRDSSEISKCSDVTESDASMSETLSNDNDIKELNKKLDKPKTDVDVDIENNVQISTIEKVPSHNIVSTLESDTKDESETSTVTNDKKKNKKKLSLTRSTSLDSDNNNSSNRLKLGNLHSSLDIEEKASLLLKTENKTLFNDRSSVLTSMSKAFNSKEVSKNIRKARRGRKAGGVPKSATATAKMPVTSTITNDAFEDKHETIDTISKEITDLISNLDQTSDQEDDMETTNALTSLIESPVDPMTKTVSKFYGLSKPLTDNNSIAPETPVKDFKEALSTDNTPSKNSENMKLHYEEDSTENCSDPNKQEVTYKISPVASIDKLMDRLKEFEEFDKRRQRQESESKSNDTKQVMVTNDVVLIPKSGADIKPLKDIQSARSPERPIEKENMLSLSCFDNNSAISIVKRDLVRKSIDIDLPNSVTLIKRNSISRKESTGSNHSKESSDAISIFEKSLGRDVTLTEIKKTVDKINPVAQVDLHQFATMHPNHSSHNIVGAGIDAKQVSITPRIGIDAKQARPDVTKRRSRESISRKSSGSGTDAEFEKIGVIEKIKSPVRSMKSPSIIPTIPVAIKSPEAQPMETEPLAPPLTSIKAIPDGIPLTSEIPIIAASEVTAPTASTTEVTEKKENPVSSEATKDKIEVTSTIAVKVDTEETKEKEKPLEIAPKLKDSTKQNEDLPRNIEQVKPEVLKKKEESVKTEDTHSKISEAAEVVKPGKSPDKGNKSARNSTESLPGSSTMLHESPENQRRKENVLRTLGLLTHKAAKEAKIEKQKEKERIYGNMISNKHKAHKSGLNDYTGTLKTVIKLNRGSGERERKKYRSSLKMTFQKSKNRSGKNIMDTGEATCEDEAYYTIERREGIAGGSTDGGHRKSYSNRFGTHDAEPIAEALVEPSKETVNLVIPEKASSFSIHPDRLCMDQCFYCGGKFGLFDTPCHIAQMKSGERQKKVLANEEKLTIDSCLCDACYRHVDRRANCPSYRKRPVVKQLNQPLEQPVQITHVPEKPLSPPLEDESEEDAPLPMLITGRPAMCHTEGCSKAADRSIRRKWLIKMRSSVNKILKLEIDYPGLHTIPLCSDHYRALSKLMSCVMCRKTVTKHQNVHTIHHGFSDLNPLLKQAGIPVQFTERPVLCKLCRYYCTLLLRPGHRDQHAATYRRKLLQLYNIEVPPEAEIESASTDISMLEMDGTNIGKHKKKAKTKSKRKSAELGEPPSDVGDKPGETKDDKPMEDSNNTQKPEQPMEEDIESLISSNKIPVPGTQKGVLIEPLLPNDGISQSEEMADLEGPLIPLDKQTELQYLLQKQNNPAQFLPQPLPNLTQKHRHGMKVSHSHHGIHKPGHQQRINDKNAKRIQKLGQILAAQVHKEVPQKDVTEKKDENGGTAEPKECNVNIIQNVLLNEECTIESIPNKKPADINTLKCKWQMSESSKQVKKNLSELSKKITLEKGPPKTAEQKYSNPVKRLETNPSISVRELFPGEEEMNLQCNIEFNNVKGVTPEGWEKCNTTIQYDVETKRLWNDLQRPYGNQSSFLRHLVILEKYFRNGDLVLAPNATQNAAVYSDSVQSRLRSYDNIAELPRRPEQPVSLLEFRKQKPAMNGKSLLKSNQNVNKIEDKPSMPPPGAIPKPHKPKAKPLPPELIAINTPNSQGRKAIQNVLHNIQQLVKGVSASDPIEVASSPLPAPATITKIDVPKEKEKEVEKKSETPKKQKTTSKPWRPTLMPITPENVARIGREPPQVAVDGRSLPSLVQVMSSGKRYHITLQDYNKMCVMRREKLQQLQDGESGNKRLSTETDTTIEIQATALGNGGTVKQNTLDKQTENEKKLEAEQIGNAVTILKNVGLKNITIAPITSKSATVTSHSYPLPTATSPALFVATPLKIPVLGPAVSITSETVLTPTLAAPIASTSAISNAVIMPKIPKSLTVIPQTLNLQSVPQAMTVTSVAPTPSQAVITPSADGQRP